MHTVPGLGLGFRRMVQGLSFRVEGMLLGVEGLGLQ